MSSTLKFSSFDVSKQVFFRTEHSFAIVNLKPIAPGHVLVIPKRPEAQRLHDLSPDEVRDLFAAVQKVGCVIESLHKGNSLTIAIQDGPSAGQSVPHLHVHVIPRRPNDFVPNDQIYDHLNHFDAMNTGKSQNPPTHLKLDNEERPARSLDDMQQEAQSLSLHFQK